MTALTPIVEGDLTGAAYGAAPTWTAYSAYVLNDVGVDITWGRQDQHDEVTPTQFSFLLDNRDGRFTTGGSIIEKGHRFRARVTTNAVTYDRCSGYVDAVEATWRGGVQTFSVIKVTCVDVTGTGNRLPLRSLYEYEVLADTPNFLYAMGEANPSSAAADIGPNRLDPATRYDGKYGAGQLEFGSAMDGTLEGFSGVRFGGDGLLGGTAALSVLALPRVADAFVPPTGAHTQEVLFITPDALPGASLFIVDQSSTTNLSRAVLFINSSGALVYKVLNATASQTALAVSPTSFCDGRLHHIVGYLTADGLTAGLIVDGVLVDTDTSGGAVTLTGIDLVQLGGIANVGNGYTGACMGTLAMYAMYETQLSLARATAHYAAAVGTGPLESSDARYTRLLGYGGLTTAGLPTGIATMAGQKIAGVTLTEALRKVANTEGSVSFVKPNGNPTFQARNARYWPTSAFTIAASDLEPSSALLRKDGLGLVNDQTVTRDGGAAQRVVDATSVALRGTFDGGGVDVAPSTDFDALQNAAWRVATGAAPTLRMPDVGVNLLANTSTTLVAALLNATISTAFTVGSMPSGTPGGASQFLFIEGGTEHIALDQWDIAFYTSQLAQSGVSFTSGGGTPTLPNTLRADATPSERTKLDAGLLIPF